MFLCCFTSANCLTVAWTVFPVSKHIHSHKTQISYPQICHWHTVAVLNKQCPKIGQFWLSFRGDYTSCHLLIILCLLSWTVDANSMTVAELWQMLFHMYASHFTHCLTTSFIVFSLSLPGLLLTCTWFHFQYLYSYWIINFLLCHNQLQSGKLCPLLQPFHNFKTICPLHRKFRTFYRTSR